MKDNVIERKVTEILADTTFEDWLRNHQHMFRFRVYPEADYCQEDIGVMDLSPRSYNCLRRAGVMTVADLIGLIKTPGALSRIRNCGIKSQREIQIYLFLFQYSHIKPERIKEYQEIIKNMNS